MTGTGGPFDVVVVGAGIHGLSTAWNLARLGAPLRATRVALVERFRIGHDRGSSHGASRITRTSYRRSRYARLVAVAQREDWPRLERDAGARLVHPTPGLFFGPSGGTIEEYARAVAEAGAPVDRVDVAHARRRFPAFAFPGDPAVLVDRSAGVIAAAETIAALARLVRAAGVELLEETEVLSIDASPGRVDVRTSRGVLSAEKAVVTAGAWTGRLVPSIARRFSVVRQTVVHVEPPRGDAAAYRAPTFPVWVWLGQGEHDHFYGLPEFGRPGLKAARHATGAGSDDPDASPAEPPPAAVAEVASFLARELVTPPGAVLAAERCLYTNTPTEDFVLGPLPSAPRVIVGAACSGHAFKFGPLVGRLLAETALRGTTSCPEYESERAPLAPSE